MSRRRGALLPASVARLGWCAALLGGCGDYDPPVLADHAAPAYQADLATCQAAGDAAADRRAKATFPMFATYPVSLPWEQRVLISRCMAAKGYKDRS